MKRALIALLLAVGLGLSARRGEAQVALSFGPSGDTAVAIFPGAMTAVDVQVGNLPSNFSGCYYLQAPPYNYYLYNYYCLTYARVTIGFDASKVDSIAVESSNPGMPSVSGTSPGAGRYTVTASGALGGYQVTAFRLRVRLAAGATNGVYLWMHADSLVSSNLQVTTGAIARIGTLCHASHIYGDVDGNGQVDSRDALITLSAAVGLPVGGFSLDFGDVDEDGLVNSRDALMMLSYAIALPVNQSNRLGVGVSDACPGLTAPGETVVFNRNVGGSGGIFRLDAAGGAPVQLTSVLTDQWPRLNHAGTSVVFQCDSLGDPLVCRTTSAGANRATLLTSNPPGSYAGNSTQPDWSLDGLRIAFNTRGGFGIGTMDTLGNNQFSSGVFGSSVAWARVGDSLAVSNPFHFDIFVFPIGAPPGNSLDGNPGDVTYAAPIRWSPDGHTLATISYNNDGGSILTIPRTGGTPVYALAPNGIRAFDWGPRGVIFAMPDAHGSLSLWMLQGGFGGPVVRLTNPGFGSGQADDQPSFRRNP